MIDNAWTALVICTAVICICIASVARDWSGTDDTKLIELERRIEQLEKQNEI